MYMILYNIIYTRLYNIPYGYVVWSLRIISKRTGHSLQLRSAHRQSGRGVNPNSVHCEEAPWKRFCFLMRSKVKLLSRWVWYINVYNLISYIYIYIIYRVLILIIHQPSGRSSFLTSPAVRYGAGLRGLVGRVLRRGSGRSPADSGVFHTDMEKIDG